MTCARCHRDLDPDSAFCRFCGHPVGGGVASGRLSRRPAEGRIAGVCAGLADYFQTDVTLVRLVWVILSIVPGGLFGGVIAYVIAWMIMPEHPSLAPPAQPRRRLTRSVRDRKIAGVCGGLAEYFGVDPTAIRLLWIVLTIVPGAIVLGVLVYLVAWFVMPQAETETLPPDPAAAI